jgi:hypothetical protein
MEEEEQGGQGSITHVETLSVQDLRGIDSWEQILEISPADVRNWILVRALLVST